MTFRQWVKIANNFKKFIQYLSGGQQKKVLRILQDRAGALRFILGMHELYKKFEDLKEAPEIVSGILDVLKSENINKNYKSDIYKIFCGKVGILDLFRIIDKSNILDRDNFLIVFDNLAIRLAGKIDAGSDEIMSFLVKFTYTPIGK